MKRTTREWIDKAAGDAVVAERELAAPNPVTDAVCFHAQQCVEKLPKGVLEEHAITSPRTHDLLALGLLAVGLVPALVAHQADLALLTGFAVAPRYPGASTNRDDAEAAIAAMRTLRPILRSALPL
jgi:HEPN domain-containing protein